MTKSYEIKGIIHHDEKNMHTLDTHGLSQDMFVEAMESFLKRNDGEAVCDALIREVRDGVINLDVVLFCASQYIMERIDDMHERNAKRSRTR